MYTGDVYFVMGGEEDTQLRWGITACKLLFSVAQNSDFNLAAL